MDGETPADRLRDNATEIASTIVTGIWLAALLTGQSWWLGALIVGYVIVVPIVSMLFGDDDEEADNWLDSDWWDDLWNSSVTVGTTDEEPEETTTTETPLETLRRRYAAGELTDEQFERKLERLLETETLEDVEERAAREQLREREY
ncbi:Short C-terminal domain-containing protein [Halogranum rubrum]|uniref:Short C-terminal domain-containing protein n=1 Tax=Halogranum rubrum TaxID=553466 RepID=A0A1I4D7Y3_9EURY|nr:SHOCT domain-containing protein [Halogranum rubrum]SFK88071.1 Short C-terminal domain-containing protein [Halogranum rubrum]